MNIPQSEYQRIIRRMKDAEDRAAELERMLHKVSHWLALVGSQGTCNNCPAQSACDSSRTVEECTDKIKAWAGKD